MGPVAAAGYLLLTSAFLDAVIVGAFAGAIAWAVKRNLLWVGPLLAGGHLAATGLLASYSLKAAALFGIPALVLTLLISWLAAGYLEVRAKWRPMWAVLAAICCGLIAGFTCRFLFRLSMWAPPAFAATTDVVLILFLLFLSRRRKPVGHDA
jgi:hypothetical protein